MRRAAILVVVGVAAYLLAGTPPAVKALDYSYARIVRLSLVEGSVEVSRPGRTGEQKAIANLPLEQGASLATGANGRAEIEFESQEVAELAGNARLGLSELALSNGGRITRLTLSSGTASLVAEPARKDVFSLETPGFTVRPVKKSSFRVDVEPSGGDVRVFKGEVEVQSPAGTQRVKKGHALVAEGGAIRIIPNPPADAWDDWVAERTQVETAQLASVQKYTQAPFTYGLADLASFGYWYWIPGYGNAWQPLGVPAGWAPFFDGYWGFFPGFGWTWVSFEPWGWVPYHFGRWVFIPGFGWAWLPGYYSYWCPAPVFWYQTANWIGWAPLPPKTQFGEVPRDPPRTRIVVNSSTGLRNHGPNRIVEPPVGSTVTVSGFAPLPPPQAGFTGTLPLPRLLAPVNAKLPRALPPPTMGTSLHMVVKPAPPAPAGAPKGAPVRQPIIVAPKPVAPGAITPSSAPPRRQPSIPSPQPMPRVSQPPPPPPRSTPPPHNFVMEGGHPPRMARTVQAAPRMSLSPARATAEPRVLVEEPKPSAGSRPPHR